MWYKLELKGGKGHTNQEEKYIWSDYEWDKIEKQHQWDSWSNNFGYERMWDGHVKLVKKLPENVIKKMLKNCQSQIDSLQKRITLLKDEEKKSED
jgi:hypothetical protein